jgi:DNA polymerase
MSYGRPMDLFSSMLRGVIQASPGFELFCADYSSIEARVLLWCAGDSKGLKEYEAGIDAYKSMAATIFGVSIEDVTKDQRQLGKQVVLACGYQMGVKKFKITALQNGLDVPESLLQRAHEAFRIKYPSVPQVWVNYELAAIKAVTTKKAYTVNQVTWFVQRDFLCAKLPSGRCLYYYKPRVQNEETPWGELRPKLYHYSVDSLSKKWTESATYGGKLTENIVQAISRDCMAEAMPRVENAGFQVLITVHDEVLCEAPLSKKTLEHFKTLMSERPKWGRDIPLSVSGYKDPRYKK